MPTYTVISQIADDMHVTQHDVAYPNQAVCDHISSRGLARLYDFTEAQIEQWEDLADEPDNIALQSMQHLLNTWRWTSATHYPDFPQLVTICVVQTDTLELE